MSKAGDFTAEFGKNLGIQEEEKMQRETFRLNNMIVHSGEKKDGYLELADGKFQIPVTIFHGEQSGKMCIRDRNFTGCSADDQPIPWKKR